MRAGLAAACTRRCPVTLGELLTQVPQSVSLVELPERLRASSLTTTDELCEWLEHETRARVAVSVVEGSVLEALPGPSCVIEKVSGSGGELQCEALYLPANQELERPMRERQIWRFTLTVPTLAALLNSSYRVRAERSRHAREYLPWFEAEQRPAVALDREEVRSGLRALARDHHNERYERTQKMRDLARKSAVASPQVLIGSIRLRRCKGAILRLIRTRDSAVLLQGTAALSLALAFEDLLRFFVRKHEFSIAQLPFELDEDATANLVNRLLEMGAFEWV
jgi:hypothetical protein